MPIQTPAVPYTPEMYVALPSKQQPVFFYRCNKAQHDEYAAAFAEWMRQIQASSSGEGDWSETQILDHQASMLGHALVYAQIGEESSTYPDAHDERLAWLAQWPAMAIVQLCIAVKNQAYRTASLGK